MLVLASVNTWPTPQAVSNLRLPISRSPPRLAVGLSTILPQLLLFLTPIHTVRVKCLNFKTLFGCTTGSPKPVTTPTVTPRTPAGTSFPTSCYSNFFASSLLAIPPTAASGLNCLVHHLRFLLRMLLLISNAPRSTWREALDQILLSWHRPKCH